MPVTFKGQEIEIPELTVLDGMRLAKVIREAVRHIPVDAEEIKTMNMSLADLFSLSLKILDAAFDDYDLENNRLGKFADLVFGELSRITGLPKEHILAAGQNDFVNLVTEIWRKESEGPFVQKAWSLIRPLFIPLYMLFATLKSQTTNLLLSRGGLTSGGEHSLSSLLSKRQMAGENETSLNSVSEVPLDTSEPVLSGAS